jgi:protein-S-isoprenylcysteine O-methyltransferase Ste14
MLPLLLFRTWRGREARPASVARNAAKTLAQIVVMWSIFFALLPLVIYYIEGAIGLSSVRFDSTTWVFVGVVVFVLGGALGLVSAAYMVAYGQGTPLPVDCPREMVVRGPYRHIRNPMAAGSFAQGVAVGLMLGSPLVVAYALAGAVGWNYFVRPMEEMDLERRFGQPYARYRDSVRCWLPTVQGYRGR